MQVIKILCNCGYSWETSINDTVSIQEVKQYFINKPFNVGTDEVEKIVIPNQVLFKGLDYL